MYFNWL